MLLVIDHSSVKGRDHKQWCYVVDNEEYVMTRFFFIFGNSGAIPQNLNARELKLPNIQSFGLNFNSNSKKTGWWKRLTNSTN